MCKIKIDEARERRERDKERLCVCERERERKKEWERIPDRQVHVLLGVGLSPNTLIGFKNAWKKASSFTLEVGFVFLAI